MEMKSKSNLSELKDLQAEVKEMIEVEKEDLLQVIELGEVEIGIAEMEALERRRIDTRLVD